MVFSFFPWESSLALCSLCREESHVQRSQSCFSSSWLIPCSRLLVLNRLAPRDSKQQLEVFLLPTTGVSDSAKRHRFCGVMPTWVWNRHWARGGCAVTLDSRGVFSPFVPKLQQLVHTQKRAACFPIKTGSSATRPFLEIRYSFQCVCLEALGYLNHFLVYFPRHKRYHVWNTWNENVKVFGWILSTENIFAYCSFSVKILK